MSLKTQYIDRGWIEPICLAACIIPSAVALFEFRIHTSMYGFDQRINDIFTARRHPERPDLLIRDHYTGIWFLDAGLTFLVTVFLHAAAPFLEHYQVQLAYFLLGIFPLITIFTVESLRIGNVRTWFKYTSGFAVLYQVIGGAVVIPIWIVLFLRHTRQSNLYDQRSLRVPIAYARGLIPALILGYLLPTVALFMPDNDPNLWTRQAFLASWQICPIYPNILLFIIAQFSSRSRETTASSSTNDAVYIKAAYAVSFIVSLLTHIIVLYQYTHSQWSLADLFLPKPAAVQGAVHEMLYYIFQLDLAICGGVMLVAAYVVLTDLKALGRSDMSGPVVIGLLVGLTVLIGPGATVAAAFWWREGRLRAVPDVGEKKRS